MEFTKVSKEKEYVCKEYISGQGICGKVFGRSADLNRHVEIHKGPGKLKCTYENCDRRFRQQTALETHLRVHSQEKPYLCPYTGCKRHTDGFVDSSAFSRHMKEVHRTKGGYKCPAKGCSTSIKRRSEFVRHLKESHPGLKLSKIEIEKCAPPLLPKSGKKVQRASKSGGCSSTTIPESYTDDMIDDTYSAKPAIAQVPIRRSARHAIPVQDPYHLNFNNEWNVYQHNEPVLSYDDMFNQNNPFGDAAWNNMYMIEQSPAPSAYGSLYPSPAPELYYSSATDSPSPAPSLGGDHPITDGFNTHFYNATDLNTMNDLNMNYNVPMSYNRISAPDYTFQPKYDNDAMQWH